MYILGINIENIPWHLQFGWELTMTVKHELEHAAARYSSNDYVENDLM